MDSRTAVTIRFPTEVLQSVKDAAAPGESINGFVLSAVEREVKRRVALKAHERILAMREQIESRTGIQPSSVELIRELREGIGRRD